MTTVPLIGRRLSSERIASTATWSAAFSSPRPRSRAAATAARSVTRTSSRVSMRSRPLEAALAIMSILGEVRWSPSRLAPRVKEAEAPQEAKASPPERLSIGWPRRAARRPLDADALRLGGGVPVLRDALDRRAHRRLRRLVGDEDDGLLLGRVGAVGVLDDRFERDVVA